MPRQTSASVINIAPGATARHNQRKRHATQPRNTRLQRPHQPHLSASTSRPKRRDPARPGDHVEGRARRARAVAPRAQACPAQGDRVMQFLAGTMTGIIGTIWLALWWSGRSKTARNRTPWNRRHGLSRNRTETGLDLASPGRPSLNPSLDITRTWPAGPFLRSRIDFPCAPGVRNGLRAARRTTDRLRLDIAPSSFTAMARQPVPLCPAWASDGSASRAPARETRKRKGATLRG